MTQKIVNWGGLQFSQDDTTKALFADVGLTITNDQATTIGAAIGAATPEGATTDAPLADNTTAESATARTGVSLWKRVVNLGIAILAKLPAFGTAGTASANVLTVQGVASMTAVKTDGSAVVQPTCAGESLKAVSDPIVLGASATLGSLAAAVAGLKRFAIIPSSDATGYYAYSKAASGSTAKIPSTPIVRACNATDYALVRVYGTAGSIVIEQYA